MKKKISFLILLLWAHDFRFRSVWDVTGNLNTTYGIKLKDSISKKISSQRSKLEKAKEELEKNALH